MGTLSSLHTQTKKMQKYSIFNAVRFFFCPQPKCSTAFSSRWRSVDGNDDACRSCDSSHQEVSQSSDMSLRAKDLPFVMSHQTQNRPEQAATFNFELGAQHRTTYTEHSNLRPSFAGQVKKGAGAGELNIPCLHALNSAEKQKLYKHQHYNSTEMTIVSLNIVSTPSNSTTSQCLSRVGFCFLFFPPQFGIFVTRDTIETYLLLFEYLTLLQYTIQYFKN